MKPATEVWGLRIRIGRIAACLAAVSVLSVPVPARYLFETAVYAAPTKEEQAKLDAAKKKQQDLEAERKRTQDKIKKLEGL